MRAVSILSLVVAILLACGGESTSVGAKSEPVVTAMASEPGYDYVDGIRTLGIDITFQNITEDSLDLRYFVHAETPTGDIAHRRVYPMQGYRFLGDRVSELAFRSQVEPPFAAGGAELTLAPGESRSHEVRFVLRAENTPFNYSDFSVYVYRASGERVAKIDW